MKNQAITAVVLASLSMSMPQTAAADAKDVLIGGIVGAIITDSIHRDQKRKEAASTRSASTSRNVAPSLNSQYSGPERVQIQTSLQGLGYGIGSIDGVLGKNSRRAIVQFQASRAEAQTGQLTRPQFLALTNPGFQTAPVLANRPLVRDEVVLLQQGLQRLGYYGGYIDGSNGPGTRGATAAFLSTQGMNPAQTSDVVSVVAVSTAAGIPAPFYLQQEANAHMAAANAASPFGAPAQPQVGFGAPAQHQAGFGAPAAPQQQNLFGTPAQQPGVTAAAPSNLFGAPQQQTANPAGALFGGAPQQQVPQGGAMPPANNQQQLFAPAPQQVPQSGNGNTLFASGVPTAQPQLVPQQQQSTLDVFSIQPSAPVTTQPEATQLAGQQPAAQQPGVSMNATSTLFAVPTAQTLAATGQTVQGGGTGSLDIFGTGSN